MIENRKSHILVLGLLFIGLIASPFSHTILLAESADIPPDSPWSSLDRLHQRIESLAAEAERLFKGAMAAEDSTNRRLEEEIERARQVLRALDRELREKGTEALLAKLGRIETRLDDARLALNHAPHSRRDASEPVRLVPVNAVDVVPVNDDCANAIPLRLGDTAIGDLTLATRDGDASCGSSAYSRDVWFLYTAESYQTVNVDLFGSSFDTVLSVHRACPGTRDNEVVCNDDRIGLDSGTGFSAAYGATYWIRVSGFSDAAGPFELHLGPGGLLSGRVTEEDSALPLAGGFAKARETDGYITLSAKTSADGTYFLPGLDPEGHWLWTEGFPEHLEELHREVPCPEGDCDKTLGTVIALPSNGLGTVDIALGKGGAIEGSITDASTGDPLGDVRVEVWSQDQRRLGFDLTDAAGSYRVTGLPSDEFLVSAQSPDHLDELYDDLPCNGGLISYECPTGRATLVPVAETSVTSGIDFSLDRFGGLSGTITNSQTGDPLPDATVDIRTSEGDRTATTTTDGSGSYFVGGLVAGDYIALASSPMFQEELYNDIPCPGGFYDGCSFSDATPIAVAFDTVTAGVDFTLMPLGAISGHLSDATTGAALPSVAMSAQLVGDGQSYSATTDANGDYLLTRLPAGDWRVWTRSDTYADETFDDVICEGRCPAPIETATTVSVALDNITTGIDFALIRTGAIRGTVRESATDVSVPSARVAAYSTNGNSAGSDYTDSAGRYEIDRLAPGTYYVAAVDSYWPYVNQLYDGLPFGDDPTLGTPVTVSSSMTTSGIDFALDRRGALRVRAIDCATGHHIPDHRFTVFDDEGNWEADATTSVFGTATFESLNNGHYYLRSNDYDNLYLEEIYDNIPCSNAGYCDPVKGTPIVITAGVTIERTVILIPADATGITGRVEDLSGAPLSGVTLDLWDAAGAHLSTRTSLTTGEYLFPALAAGTYYASVRESPDIAGQLWRGVPCPTATCDPTSGTPIVVGATVPLSLVSGIDFALGAGIIFDDGFETGDISFWSSTFGS